MLTITAINAEISSIGEHTKLSTEMLVVARDGLAKAKMKGQIASYGVMHTGSNLRLLMIHKEGRNSPEIHELAWSIFEQAIAVAKEQGFYGVGQDLLKEAPSGIVRGAGTEVAEITFDITAKERPAEPFLIFTPRVLRRPRAA